MPSKRFKRHHDLFSFTSSPLKDDWPSHNYTYWPYQHRLMHSNIQEVERWCYANLKTKNWRNELWAFAFKRKEDYVLFRLRWE